MSTLSIRVRNWCAPSNICFLGYSYQREGTLCTGDRDRGSVLGCSLQINGIHISVPDPNHKFLGLPDPDGSESGSFHHQARLVRKFAQICENNSFMNVRNRCCLNRGKSLRQCEKICEIAFWQKSAKKGACVYVHSMPCT